VLPQVMGSGLALLSASALQSSAVNPSLEAAPLILRSALVEQLRSLVAGDVGNCPNPRWMCAHLWGVSSVAGGCFGHDISCLLNIINIMTFGATIRILGSNTREVGLRKSNKDQH